MRTASLRLIAVALLLCSACAKAPVKSAAFPPGPTPAERLAAADRLVRAGCLDCLFDAYREYQSLRSVSPSAHAATLGAIRAAGLIGLRQRELGMVDEGYIATAKRLAADTPDLPAWVAGTLDVTDVLEPSIGGATRRPSSDADLDRIALMRRNSAAYRTLLRDFSQLDELSAYAWASFMCDGIERRDVTAAEIFAAASTFRDTPLLLFKEATCRGVQPEKLTPLIDADPRWVEVTYVLGRFEVGRRKLDAADAQFLRAYAWHPVWPALTQSMANLAMTTEDFANALRLYDETLAAEPRALDSLLGKVKALTYLGKAVEAIAAVDQMLGERWNLGDARYWRALNENQLDRYEDAWSDVELADKLLINADVPKLAGIIAYRRQALEIAQKKFELARDRNGADCETAFYLGVVLGDQRIWVRTASVMGEAVTCLELAEEDARRDIVAIRASTDPPQRQARQIARREKQIADGRRMIVTSWFNTAVAYYNLSKKDEARQFAEKVSNDEQFGDRAKEILARLAKSP